MASKKRPKTEPKEDWSKKPWVSNYPPLHSWLQKHEARCMYQLPIGGADDPQAYVETYAVHDKNGVTRTLVVTVFSNKNGWEIYTPCGAPKVQETLDDAEKRLGLV